VLRPPQRRRRRSTRSQRVNTAAAAARQPPTPSPLDQPPLRPPPPAPPLDQSPAPPLDQVAAREHRRRRAAAARPGRGRRRDRRARGPRRAAATATPAPPPSRSMPPRHSRITDSTRWQPSDGVPGDSPGVTSRSPDRRSSAARCGWSGRALRHRLFSAAVSAERSLEWPDRYRGHREPRVWAWGSRSSGRSPERSARPRPHTR
jgi:hypothetical protein